MVARWEPALGARRSPPLAVATPTFRSSASPRRRDAAAEELLQQSLRRLEKRTGALAGGPGVHGAAGSFGRLRAHGERCRETSGHLSLPRSPNRRSPHHPTAGRALRQNKSAYSSASGGQSASASAVAGPGGASTSQQATGAGSQVQGITQVGQKVDTCQRGPANSAACQTLTLAGARARALALQARMPLLASLTWPWPPAPPSN